MGKHKKKTKAEKHLKRDLLATLDVTENTVFSSSPCPAIAQAPSMPLCLTSLPVQSRNSLDDSLLTIQQLQQQITQAHQQLETQALEYQQLIETHKKLQEKSTQQAVCIDQLQQRILHLESQLQKLYTASPSQPDASMASSTLPLPELTEQVKRLKQQLMAQTEARHHAEEQNRTLSQQLHDQIMTIESLQAQIQNLHSTAQIGESYLNRWQKHQFRG